VLGLALDARDGLLGVVERQTTTSSSTAGGVPLEYAVLAGAARLPQFSGVEDRLTSA
jgi:hypothetical protein